MKSLLIYNKMPKDCSVCAWEAEDSMTKEECCLAVPYMDKIGEYFGTEERPAWCPLKPMPAKKVMILDDLYSTWYSKGWNDCLEALGGVDDE